MKPSRDHGACQTTHIIIYLYYLCIIPVLLGASTRLRNNCGQEFTPVVVNTYNLIIHRVCQSAALGRAFCAGDGGL